MDMQRWNPCETVINADNVASMQLRWSHGNVISSPAVVNGMIFIGSNDGSVYALKASSGSKLGSFATQSHVQSSPAVVNGKVYVSSDDNNLYALDTRTGALLWSYTVGLGLN